MTWLQARLAFENHEPEQSIKLVDALVAAPARIESGLHAQITSTAVLLKAQAEFALGREPAALETLRRLREEFKKTDAAIWSYIIESEHYALQDKIDKARTTLVDLTDDKQYQNSGVVPYALYRLALLSERLGRDENLTEAIKRLEELITHPAAVGEADLVFTARMKEGDIFAKRNDLPAAQRAYEEVINRFGRRPDVVIAQLALAKTHNAQSSADPTGVHLEAAQHLFEQLLDRVDAPAGIRVEAGYNLGKLLERRGKFEQADKVWWNDVLDGLWLKAEKTSELGAAQPYWLARTLLDLGDLRQKQGRLSEAAAAYKLIIEKRLPTSGAVAKARLEQLGVPSPSF
jgi:cellulose synthase operon protein C